MKVLAWFHLLESCLSSTTEFLLHKHQAMQMGTYQEVVIMQVWDENSFHFSQHFWCFVPIHSEKLPVRVFTNIEENTIVRPENVKVSVFVVSQSQCKLFYPTPHISPVFFGSIVLRLTALNAFLGSSCVCTLTTWKWLKIPETSKNTDTHKKRGVVIFLFFRHFAKRKVAQIARAAQKGYMFWGEYGMDSGTNMAEWLLRQGAKEKDHSPCVDKYCTDIPAGSGFGRACSQEHYFWVFLVLEMLVHRCRKSKINHSFIQSEHCLITT